MSTTVMPGGTYSLSMQAGSSWSQGFGVWIDYNGDGDFDDAGEFVYASPTSSTSLYSTNITVPVTAIPGTTRLRVRCRYASTVTSAQSCANGWSFGETEDYVVNIQSPSPNDMGITAINSPVSGCGLSSAEQVSVDVTNFGTNSQTGFTVSYQVNGGAVVTENVGATAWTSGSTQNYTFTTTANLATPGIYTIKSWTNLSGDGFTTNDTSVTTVTNIPVVNTFPYAEDFEGGQGGWTSGGANNTWAFGMPGKPVIVFAASGVNAWVTGGLSTGTYSANEQSWVMSPCFDFSTLSNPWITLKTFWYSEGSFDGAVLQYSLNGGTTWTTIGQYNEPWNWYNQQSLWGSPGGSSEGWGGTGQASSGGWVMARHRLDGLAGQSAVRLRIAFGADGSVQYDGIAFDDIFIGDGPMPSLGPDLLMCGGDTTYLNPGNYAGYMWSTGDTSQVDTILTPGTYSVVVEDTFGFLGFDTVAVSYSIPTVSLGPDTSDCPGDSIILNAGNPGASYIWSTGDTTQSVTLFNGGTIWVEITDTVGCKTTDTLSYIKKPQPVVNLGSDTAVCMGASVPLDAGGNVMGATYLWNTGATTQVYHVTAPGTYAVTVTGPGGCSASDTANVIQIPSPAVSLGPDRTECSSFVLDAGNPGASYLWSTGASAQSINVSSSGTYWVQVTNTSGCVSTDTVNITMGTAPGVSLGPDQQICNSQNIVLDAGNPGASYSWSTGASTQQITVNTPGLYIVYVTNAAGCTGADTVNVTGSNLNVNLGPDGILCSNKSVTLDAGSGGISYSWSNGSTTQVVTISQPGGYSVIVTDGAGCSAKDSITLSGAPGVTAAFNTVTSVPMNQQINLTDNSTPAPSSWTWDFGDGTGATVQNPAHTYQAMGTFTIQLIASNGSCSDTTTQQITVTDPVGIDEASFASSLEIYPNPASDVFRVDAVLVEAGSLSIGLYDLTGHLLRSWSSDNGLNHSKDCGISDIPGGVYIVRLETGGKVIFKKLSVY